MGHIEDGELRDAIVVDEYTGGLIGPSLDMIGSRYASPAADRRPRPMPRQARLDAPGTVDPVFSLADTARQLGVSTSGIAKAVARAERPEVH